MLTLPERNREALMSLKQGKDIIGLKFRKICGCSMQNRFKKGKTEDWEIRKKTSTIFKVSGGGLE